MLLLSESSAILCLIVLFKKKILLYAYTVGNGLSGGGFNLNKWSTGLVKMIREWTTNVDPNLVS